jgi:hypothetical protein
VVPDYTVKPPVTQFYSHRGAGSLDAPTSSDDLSSDVTSSALDVPSSALDVPSSPPIEPSSPIDSSLEQLVRRGHHLCGPPDCYSHSAFIIIALSESASYHNAILFWNGSTRWLSRLLLLS